MLGLAFDISSFHMPYEALLQTNANLTRAEETERERLGRELHDSLSQLLVGAQLTLGSLKGSAPAAEHRKLDDVDRVISAALAEIRTFSFLLHPPDLKQLGLARALRSLCDGFCRRAELSIAVSDDQAVGRQSEDLEFAFFRVAQEALMNVHRHAHAKVVSLRLRQVGDTLQLEIIDDGVGIATSKGRLNLREFAGVGISGMRARMHNVGGDVLFENCNPGLRVLARAKAPRRRSRSDPFEPGRPSHRRPGPSSVRQAAPANAVLTDLISRTRSEIAHIERSARIVWLAGVDRRTPWSVRTVCVAAAAYVASPVQLLPNFIPVIGLLDDIVVIGVASWLATRLMPAEVLDEIRLTVAKSMTGGEKAVPNEPGPERL
jgi:uncharacterized membrane protein YkvA (DUF1232 family)